ncbi:hypothetical protein HN51_060004 [Arachis hypogaea]
MDDNPIPCITGIKFGLLTEEDIFKYILDLIFISFQLLAEIYLLLIVQASSYFLQDAQLLFGTKRFLCIK